ncbi:sigma-70 family RNA polymerase sigma factor [Tissierella praeacuta]|uniref:sigma-70 family RNA polymerase sigma factor n=1 Tax=Tissierella praeacuta TaxID=43131 RepID=UPI003DA43679
MEGVDRDTFILENMGLVGMVAKEFQNRIYNSSCVEMDDLVQIGTIGLIKAYDRFDPEQGVKFAGFAITSIRWEIQMFLRDKLDGVKVGGNTVYNYLNILQSNLINESPGVISSILDIPIQSVENALAYHRCKYIDSLEKPISNDDGDTFNLGETIGYEVDFHENLEMYRLQEILKKLDERTQEILKLKLQGLNQHEIGKSLGLSQSYISRLTVKAKQKLEKGGYKMGEGKGKDFKLAKKLAIETELGASEISKQAGISYPTAYRYIKCYRADVKEIEEVKSKLESNQPTVKTYTLSPEELEKYREDGTVAKMINHKTDKENSGVGGINVEKHRLDIPEEVGKEEVIKEPEIKSSDGYMTMTFKLTVENAKSQLEDILKAMNTLGFKDLNITIQSQQAA